MSQGNSIASFMTGIVVGSALGIYLYVTREKAVRRGIVSRTKDLADQLNDKIEEGKTILTHLQKRTTAAKNKVARAVSPATK
jgi:hypothetical protein